MDTAGANSSWNNDARGVGIVLYNIGYCQYIGYCLCIKCGPVTLNLQILKSTDAELAGGFMKQTILGYVRPEAEIVTTMFCVLHVHSA